MKTTAVLLAFFIVACSSTKENNKEQEPEKVEQEEIIEQNPDLYRMKFEEGVDFIARGNEPFWYLEMDFDNVFRFKSLTDVEELNTPPVAGIKAQDADVTFYHVITESGELRITVQAVPCEDNMSGEPFTHTVNVQGKKSVDSTYTEFTGCGKYLMDLRLNDIWLMTEMTGVKLNKDDLIKGLPTFEFHLSDKRFVGHAGCNNLMGFIEVIGSKIKFGTITATKMACPNMEVERAVLSEISNRTVTYKIEKGELLLVSENGIEMKFKKID